MFATLERQASLTRNQKRLILAGAAGLVLEFLDYFLIGFILVFVSTPWGLSFGQSSVILFSSGIGAMIGAVYFGRLADRIGRRRVFLTTIGVFSVSMAALVVTPDSPEVGWIYLSVFRFLIGFGAGGLYCVDVPLIQEFVPSRKRGVVTGLVTCAVPLGFLIGSAMVAFLAPAIGWRGLIAVCVVLSVCTLLIRRWIPESPRWLMRQGCAEEARKSIAWALEVEPATLPLSDAPTAAPQSKFSDLLRYPRALAMTWVSNLGMQTGYYGLTLWAPTLIVQILRVPPARAGFLMIFVTAAALAGRVAFSVHRWRGAHVAGRRVLCPGSRGRVLHFYGASDAGVLLRGGWLCDRGALFGRGLAHSPSCDGHGLVLRLRRYWQDRRPIGARPDRRWLNLNGARLGRDLIPERLHLLRSLVHACLRRVSRVGDRDKGADNRGHRRGAVSDGTRSLAFVTGRRVCRLPALIA
jgi:MFS family permease